jgi:hypothetical protein
MEDEMGRASRLHGEKRNMYRELLEKACGKRQLERHRHRWEDGVILAQGGDHWRALVTKKIILWILYGEILE